MVNGLGITLWLATLADYLRGRAQSAIVVEANFFALVIHQFLIHVLLWWLLWGAHDAPRFTLLHYLYLLVGPVLLYLASRILNPDMTGSQIDLKFHYENIRRSYATVLAAFWIWAMFIRPVLHGEFATATPVFALWAGAALIARSTAHGRAQTAFAVGNCALLVIFVALIGIDLGGIR